MVRLDVAVSRTKKKKNLFQLKLLVLKKEILLLIIFYPFSLISHQNINETGRKDNKIVGMITLYFIIIIKTNY